MKNFFISSMFILCCTSVSLAQSGSDGQQIINRFFELYKTKGADAGLDYIFSTNKWMDLEGEGVRHVHSELSNIIGLIGNYLGHEEVKSVSLGKRYRIVSYLVYYERQPLRFTFQLYRGSGDWMLYNFKFDSNFEEDMEEAIRLSTPSKL
ncbi:MAG TPA: hypothetical protein VKZ68_06690 [Ohtaekwangia sp.]|nr:hypothetical protein [Ohtaekwangia sp.]